MFFHARAGSCHAITTFLPCNVFAMFLCVCLCVCLRVCLCVCLSIFLCAGCSWLLLATAGCCWLLLAAVASGCCWLLLGAAACCLLLIAAAWCCCCCCRRPPCRVDGEAQTEAEAEAETETETEAEAEAEHGESIAHPCAAGRDCAVLEFDAYHGSIKSQHRAILGRRSLAERRPYRSSPCSSAGPAARFTSRRSLARTGSSSPPVPTTPSRSSGTRRSPEAGLQATLAQSPPGPPACLIELGV